MGTEREENGKLENRGGEGGGNRDRRGGNRERRGWDVGE